MGRAFPLNYHLLHSKGRRLSSSMTTRRADWKSAAPYAPSGSVTYASQDKLPILPVPELSSTLEKLRASLKVLSSSEHEYQQASAKIDAFNDGIGPELQRRLLEHKNRSGRVHWLEQWWDDGAYLGYRDSIIINVSYFYGFDAHPSHLKQGQIPRAAALTRAVLLFRKRLKLGQIAPDAIKGNPICMDSWRWMFDCSRVPGSEGKDWSVSYGNLDLSGDAGHVVVLHRGRAWKVDAAYNGQLLSTDALEKQFQYICDETSEDALGVPVLTTSNRDVWAKNYSELLKDPQNASILRTIHSSAFTVCLDTDSPTGDVDISRAAWHGGLHGDGLSNRWADKPVNFLIHSNGEAAILGEHSVMDGTPTARMCDEVLDFLQNSAFDHGSTEPGFGKPEPLDWVISPATERAVEEAKKAAAELVDSQALGYVLTRYGKAAIKAAGYSPDSWTQLLIQLAYARLVGLDQAPAATYEAASTRAFAHGRTEAIRVATSASTTWVRSMFDKEKPDEERRELFKAAIALHGRDARDAGKAQGVDRHLFGLKHVLKDGESVPLFEDPLFKRSSYWVLSTSAIFCKHFPHYGWGEVVPDGFGVAYMTGYDDRLQFTITSRKEMPNARFCQEITRAAQDLLSLFDPKSRL